MTWPNMVAVSLPVLLGSPPPRQRPVPASTRRPRIQRTPVPDEVEAVLGVEREFGQQFAGDEIDIVRCRLLIECRRQYRSVDPLGHRQGQIERLRRRF